MSEIDGELRQWDRNVRSVLAPYFGIAIVLLIPLFLVDSPTNSQQVRADPVADKAASREVDVTPEKLPPEFDDFEVGVNVVFVAKLEAGHTLQVVDMDPMKAHALKIGTSKAWEMKYPPKEGYKLIAVIIPKQPGNTRLDFQHDSPGARGAAVREIIQIPTTVKAPRTNTSQHNNKRS